MHGYCEIYGLTEEGDRDSGRIAIKKQCKYGDQIMAVLSREFRRVLFLDWAEYLTLMYDPRQGRWWWPHKPIVAGGQGVGHDPAGGRIRARDWILGKPSFSPGPGWRILTMI